MREGQVIIKFIKDTRMVDEELAREAIKEANEFVEEAKRYLKKYVLS